MSTGGIPFTASGQIAWTSKGWRVTVSLDDSNEFFITRQGGYDSPAEAKHAFDSLGLPILVVWNE